MEDIQRVMNASGSLREEDLTEELRVELAAALKRDLQRMSQRARDHKKKVTVEVFEKCRESGGTLGGAREVFEMTEDSPFAWSARRWALGSKQAGVEELAIAPEESELSREHPTLQGFHLMTEVCKLVPKGSTYRIVGSLAPRRDWGPSTLSWEAGAVCTSATLLPSAEWGQYLVTLAPQKLSSPERLFAVEEVVVAYPFRGEGWLTQVALQEVAHRGTVLPEELFTVTEVAEDSVVLDLHEAMTFVGEKLGVPHELGLCSEEEAAWLASHQELWWANRPRARRLRRLASKREAREV